MNKIKNKSSELLGMKIKTERVRSGIKQKDLAIRIGVTSNYMYLIEKGNKTPSLKVLYKIAAELNVSPGELVKEDPLFAEIRSLTKRYDVERILQELQKLID